MKMRTTVIGAAVAVLCAFAGNATPRPAPRPALAERLAKGPEIYGIVHWGLNTLSSFMIG